MIANITGFAPRDSALSLGCLLDDIMRAEQGKNTEIHHEKHGVTPTGSNKEDKVWATAVHQTTELKLSKNSDAILL